MMLATTVSVPAPDRSLWHSQTTAYGDQFASVYDLLFPSDAGSVQTAQRLLAVAGDGSAGREPLRFAEYGIGTGRIVIETHNPARVRLLHRDERVVTYRTPVAGLAGGLLSTSRLDADGVHWSLAHEWHDPEVRRAWEFSRLIDPAELSQLAARNGFDVHATMSSWAGNTHDPLSPTYICVLRRGNSA